MARIRTIKPSFFTSLTITSLPKPTRLTFIGLWCYVDDSGRGVDDPRLIKAELWPLDDDHTAKKVDADLKRLADADLIERYEAGGRRYLRIIGWGEHQRINRPQSSKLPSAPGEPPANSPNGHAPSDEDAPIDHGTLSEDSPPEGKGREEEEEGNGISSSSHNPDPLTQPPDDDDRIGAVIDQVVTDRIGAAGGPTAHAGYRATVTTDVTHALGDRIATLVHDHPDHTVEELALLADAERHATPPATVRSDSTSSALPDAATVVAQALPDAADIVGPPANLRLRGARS